MSARIAFVGKGGAGKSVFRETLRSHEDLQTLDEEQAGLDGPGLAGAFPLGEEDEGEATLEIMEEWLAEARVDYTLSG